MYTFLKLDLKNYIHHLFQTSHFTVENIEVVLLNDRTMVILLTLTLWQVKPMKFW